MEKREKEIWKPVLNYEQYYEISSYGRVKSLPRECKMPNGGYRVSKCKILKPRIIRRYYSVSLKTPDLKYKHFRVSRLVASVFIPNPLNLKYVNHIDSNVLNNYYKNLEWVNARENQTHRYLKQNTSSKFPGVSYKKDGNRKKRWCAQLSFNKSDRFLGYFETEEEAYQAYLKALKDYGLKNKYATKSPNI